MRSIAMFLATCLAMASSASFAEEVHRLPENPYALDPTRACGPMCLGFLDSYYGGHQRYSEILENCPPGTVGTNLDQLRTAAEKLGYHVAPFKDASLGQLKRLRYPTVVHLEKESERNHFVVLLDWDAEARGFKVFDPRRGLGVTPASELAGQISGLGLVVGDKPLPPMKELFEPVSPWRLWLLGALAFAATTTVAIRWFRRGTTARSSATQAVTGTLCVLVTVSFCSSCRRAAVEPVATERTTPVAAEQTTEDGGLEIDFGDVLQGRKLEHTFQVPNGSTRAFRIKHVKKSCSCETAVVDMEREIAPGESTEVAVAFGTQGFDGPVARRYVLMTNSEETAWESIVLTIRANILTTLKAVPSKIVFGSVEEGETAKRELKVRSHLEGMVEAFRSAESDCDQFGVQLREKSMGLLVFDVELDPKCPPGDVTGSVILRFDHPDYPDFQELTVEVLARKRGAFEVIPSRLKLEPPALDIPERRKLRVASRDGQAFRVLSVEQPDGVEVTWDQGAQAAAQIDLQLEMDKTLCVNGQSFLVIHTDRDDLFVRVPIVSGDAG